MALGVWYTMRGVFEMGTERMLIYHIRFDFYWALVKWFEW